MSECVSEDDSSVGPLGTQWRVIGASIRGASHHRSETPNQDAIHWLPESGIGVPLTLVLSDGHGSAVSFRSDVGARLAVTCAAPLIQSLGGGDPKTSSQSAINRLAREHLPVEIVRAWRESVDAHLARHKFSECELDRLMRKLGKRERDRLQSNPRLAYGATLLAVLLTQSYLLFLQLGDGDILTVTLDGEVCRPVPADTRLFANETTSLCHERSWADFRVRFVPLYGDTTPVMIMAATDGYANSFVNDAGFLAVGRDVLGIVRAEGAAAVERDLDLWLREASEMGSGDDVTVGLVYVTDIDGQDRST